MKGKLYIMSADGEAYTTYFVSDNYNVMREDRIALKKLPSHVEVGKSYYVDHTMRGTMIIETLDEPFHDIEITIHQPVTYRAVLSGATEEEVAEKLEEIVNEIRNPHKLIEEINGKAHRS